jgi:hypothetical protein
VKAPDEKDEKKRDVQTKAVQMHLLFSVEVRAMCSGHSLVAT